MACLCTRICVAFLGCRTIRAKCVGREGTCQVPGSLSSDCVLDTSCHGRGRGRGEEAAICVSPQDCLLREPALQPGCGLTMNHSDPPGSTGPLSRWRSFRTIPAPLAESSFLLLPTGCQACFPHVLGWRSQPTSGCKRASSQHRLPQPLPFCPFLSAGETCSGVHCPFCSFYIQMTGKGPFWQHLECQRKRTQLPPPLLSAKHVLLPAQSEAMVGL